MSAPGLACDGAAGGGGRATVPASTVRARVVDLGLAGFAAAQLAAAAWLVPAGARVVTPGGDELGELCPVHAALGVACPLCGMTRSFVALAHGDLGASLRFHPAGPLLFAAMLAVVVAVAATCVGGARPVVTRSSARTLLERVVIATVAIGVVHHALPS